MTQFLVPLCTGPGDLSFLIATNFSFWEKTRSVFSRVVKWSVFHQAIFWFFLVVFWCENPIFPHSLYVTPFLDSDGHVRSKHWVCNNRYPLFASNSKTDPRMQRSERSTWGIDLDIPQFGYRDPRNQCSRRQPQSTNWPTKPIFFQFWGYIAPPHQSTRGALENILSRQFLFGEAMFVVPIHQCKIKVGQHTSKTPDKR